MSAPSASRWSAFSVRPPSASRSSVSATVSNRKAASSASRSGRRQRPDRRRVGRAAGARRRRRPGGPGSRLATRGEPRVELAGGRARTARAAGRVGPCGRRRGRCSARPASSRRCHRTTLRDEARRRRDDRAAQQVDPASAAAGRLDLVRGEPAVGRRERRPVAGPTRPGSASAASGSDGRARQTIEPARRRLDERPRPRLVGPDLALEVDRRPARVEPAVLAPERPGQRRPVLRLRRRPRSRRRATARATARASPAAAPASRASSSGAVSSPSSGQPTGRRSGPCRARRPSDERHAGLRDRRRGSSPGSASPRDAAAAATDGG